MKMSSIRAVLFSFKILELMATRALAQGDAAHPITLDEAVRMAQRNSPTTVQARNATRVARAGVVNSLSQYLPSLSVSAAGQRSGGATFFQGKLIPYSGDPWSYSKGYSASVQLFDGGQRWFFLRSSQAQFDADIENEQQQKFAVALNVKQQYYAVLAARESQSAAERQLENSNAQLRLTAAKVRLGAAMRLDSLRSAIAVGTARLAIITAENQLRTANASLTRLVASNVEVTAVAADTADVPHVDLDSVSLPALVESTPAVQQALATLSATRATRVGNYANYLPSLTVNYQSFGSNTSSEFNWGGGTTAPNNALTFRLSYNLFNNYGREYNVVTANANEDNADANLRDARFAARASIAQFIGDYRTAQETIDLQILQIAAGDEDLRSQQERYAVGSASFLDVLLSQSTLDAQRAQLIQARFNIRVAKAEIESIIGRELK